MYGLEKKPTALLEFDLEKDLKKDPNKIPELQKKLEARIQEIKGPLREGSKGPDLDKLGTLLHAYTALQRVLEEFLTKNRSRKWAISSRFGVLSHSEISSTNIKESRASSCRK